MRHLAAYAETSPAIALAAGRSQMLSQLKKHRVRYAVKPR